MSDLFKLTYSIVRDDKGSKEFPDYGVLSFLQSLPELVALKQSSSLPDLEIHLQRENVNIIRNPMRDSLIIQSIEEAKDFFYSFKRFVMLKRREWLFKLSSTDLFERKDEDYRYVKDLQEILGQAVTFKEYKRSLEKYFRERESVKFLTSMDISLEGEEALFKGKLSYLFSFHEEDYYLWSGIEEIPFRDKAEICIIRETFKRFIRLDESMKILKTRERLLQAEVTFPLAVYDEQKTLIFHNVHFMDLNLGANECFALEHEGSLNISNQVFGVYRRELIRNDRKLTLFYFLPWEHLSQGGEKDSGQELGIITSSIAHELNNPLGGILSAIDVLLLDDWPQETEDDLGELRKSALRCKQLVETFLGFSKMETHRHDNLSEKEGASLMEPSFDQAIALLRSRFIEKSLTVKHRWFGEEHCKAGFNPHMMTMTFYYILHEMMTLFLHHQLITGERGYLELLLTEEKTRLTIDFQGNWVKPSPFFSGRLFFHLLETLNLELQFEESRILLNVL